MTNAYRKDIDGLRALAVIPVLIYHAFHELLPGGFLGVDVFFVISGYLITGILLKELSQGRFSLISFYERRARRLLPALFLVMALTYLAGLLTLPADALKELGQSMIAVMGFASNIFFYLEQDYFAASAETLPLLHTWSLAVEEQYYVVFPLLLWATFRLGRQAVLAMMLLIFILSFALTFLAPQVYGNAHFYLPFARAWELMAGGLIAYGIHAQWFRPETLSRHWQSVGIVILGASYLLADKHMQHPGWITVPAVMATAMIIAANGKHNAFGLYRILTLNSVVWVGLISYSLYLWHNPILALLKAKYVGDVPAVYLIAALLLSVLGAWLSYRYIEQPYRDKHAVSRRHIFTYAGSGILLMIGIGLTTHLMTGMPERMQGVTAYKIDKAQSRRQCIYGTSDTRLEDKAPCKHNQQQGEPTWALWGDSHGVIMGESLADSMNVSMVHYTYTGCLPAFNFRLSNNPGCQAWSTSVLQALQNAPNITDVVLIFRGPRGYIGQPIIDAKTKRSTMTMSDYATSLEAIISKLATMGKTVHLMTPVPELPDDIEKLITPRHIFTDSIATTRLEGISKPRYLELNQPWLQRLEVYARNTPNLHVFDTFEALCGQETCLAVRRNEALYYDDNHLSLAGAEHVVEAFSQDVGQRQREAKGASR